ncbi:hypothetical protein GV751_01230 [Enterobacter hormaechei]|uniref:glucosyltransferase domain-containing protein n=1 Tax=Enterobacter hormaechei TaxID=158836 RepID=UPI0013769977|nr:glucosyltransferase domain-containing protein [Enterobacter hormaechei]NBF28247.1 hypothetical protein [Enterobacter hormaechei]
MLNKNERIAFYVLLAVSFIYVLPIITVNSYYSDDYMRAADGFFGLSGLGRPLADYFFKILSFNSHQSIDTAPFTQIISVAALSLSVVYLAKSVSTTPSKVDYFVLSALIFNPFYIQNLLYRFDSITMSIGVLCAALAVYTASKKTIPYAIISILLIMCSLSLYQPCGGIFASAVVILLVKRLIGGNIENPVKEILIYGAIFVLSYILYMAIIVPAYSSDPTRSSLIPFDSNFFPRIVHNVEVLTKKVASFSPWEGLSSILAMVVVYGLLMANVTIKSNRRLTTFIITLISLPVAYLLIGGVIIIINESIFFPRTLVCFGLFVSLLIYPTITFKGRAGIAIPVAISTAFAILSFISISVTMNAIKSQIEYEKFITSMIASDVTKINELNNSITYLGGNKVLALNAKRPVRAFPIVDMIYNPSSDWVLSYMMGQYGINYRFQFNRAEQKKIINAVCSNNIPPVVFNEKYSIYHHSGKNIAWINGAKKICE